MAAGLTGDTVVVMPMWKRTSITLIQLSMTLLTAGVIIGGVYHEKCGKDVPLNETCANQNAALEQLFNIGASVSTFIQAPSGLILNFLGPKITCLAGLVLFIPGCFLFAFAPSIHAVDAYMIGFQLLAAGGPFVFISSLPVAQLWPDKQAMILMMINGVYGGGAFVFFLFSLLFSHGVSMKSLFIGYGILGCFIVVVALLVWPRRSYSSVAKTTSVQATTPDQPTVLEIVEKSLKDIRSPHFLFLALFVPFLIYKSNFFLSTYELQFSMYLSESLSNKYVTAFGVILPGIGILAGPIGLIFDKFGANPAIALLIAFSSFSSICGLLVNVSVPAFAALQMIRIYYPMIYGVWAFALINKFGTINFGALYGVIAVLAGIVNITASNPMNTFALEKNSYFQANLILLVIGALFIVYPIISSITRKVYRNKYGSGYYEPIINS